MSDNKNEKNVLVSSVKPMSEAETAMNQHFLSSAEHLAYVVRTESLCSDIAAPSKYVTSTEAAEQVPITSPPKPVRESALSEDEQLICLVDAMFDYKRTPDAKASPVKPLSELEKLQIVKIVSPEPMPGLGNKGDIETAGSAQPMDGAEYRQLEDLKITDEKTSPSIIVEAATEAKKEEGDKDVRQRNKVSQVYERELIPESDQEQINETDEQEDVKSETDTEVGSLSSGNDTETDIPKSRNHSGSEPSSKPENDNGDNSSNAVKPKTSPKGEKDTNSNLIIKEIVTVDSEVSFKVKIGELKVKPEAVIKVKFLSSGAESAKNVKVSENETERKST